MPKVSSPGHQPSSRRDRRDMKRYGAKISKACEPCRRRKIKCNGQTPCDYCHRQPADCTYRAKARDRTHMRHRPRSGNNASNDSASMDARAALSKTAPAAPAGRDNHQSACLEVCHGITAAYTPGPDSSEHKRLFYGPSSNFAFLQQLHAEIASYGLRQQSNWQETHDGGQGLGLFAQRSNFLGPPPSLGAMQSGTSFRPTEVMSAAQAFAFLAQFKAVVSPVLPLFTGAELDRMLQGLYSEDGLYMLRLQETVLILAVLSNGALAADATDLAEVLRQQAQIIASAFDEAVTLSMVQYHMLMADYQNNMGQPNSAYLHLGAATRRAFAMGLDREEDHIASDGRGSHVRCTTMWCLYFHERWHSFSVGRSSALRFSDIRCRRPTLEPVLAILCEIAYITEINMEDMYSHSPGSLQSLYISAERTLARLHQVAEKAEIGASNLNERNGRYNEVAALALHNVYYHSIIITFRPFLVMEALEDAKQTQKPKPMWLRAACRHALAAAQDSLVFINNQQITTKTCKSSRISAFYIESCCAVLLYDSLRHPTKHAQNLDYIRTGLKCLLRMVNAELILNVRASIRRIAVAVARAVAGTSDKPSATGQLATPTTSQGFSYDRNGEAPKIPYEVSFISGRNGDFCLRDRQDQCSAGYQSRGHSSQEHHATA